MDLTVGYLRERLHYDPETGVFTWLWRAGNEPWVGQWNGRFAGAPAGSIDAKGYLTIKLDGRTYKAHHLAWLYVTGVLPKLVDHVDRVRNNNRWRNLRLATSAEQARNRPASSRSMSGVKGVSQRPDTGRWWARIYVARRMHSLGVYDSLDEAQAAYAAAAKNLHGAFACTEGAIR